ncbi:thioesterase family protein [Rubellicoccus peritrichatus]|uniref:Thioesterase family protein n=1 Tax=Rubellicoccus peritrichatus TaxID=3080537 RepID=A0AAQ3LBR8_9BACT|nr:thioesterase family protein [Puniceicoccus sp. CR14]WOO41452.1 thioesterase family protein [Puniceicoccus sp. CR14]
MSKTSQHTYRRRVEFSETDMAGIVHFSNFFRWMEAAEASLFRDLSIPLFQISGDHHGGWPRVRASCSYHAPIYFEDEVEIKLSIKAIKIRAIEYAFRFYKVTESDKQHIASGEMTTVFARKAKEDGKLESMSIPKELLDQIEDASPEALKA